MPKLIFLFIFSFPSAFAAGSGAGPGTGSGARNTQSVFDAMQTLIPKMCLPASTLRVCFSVNKETCDSRVVSAFETCLRDQKIKYAGRITLDPQSAAEAENNLKTCVLNSYAMATHTSYRKSADCDKWVPSIKKPTAKTAKTEPLKSKEVAFEDPLENQRDLVGRYKLRILHDIRLVQRLKADMDERKTCNNDKQSRESNINCFKRALAKFDVTSSTQLTMLTVVAVGLAVKDRSQGYPSTNAVLLDVTLSALERVEMEKFHLSVLKVTSEVDRLSLQLLRSDDEKILRDMATKMYAMLKAKYDEPVKGREPASRSNLKVRLDALKSPPWVYPKPAP